MTKSSASAASDESEDYIDIPSEEITAQQPSWWQRAWRKVRRQQPELITDARRSPAENRDHRIKVYSWMQAVRVPFLLLSGWTYMELRNWVLSTILFLISVPISWVSVVIGNGKGEVRDKRQRNVYKPALYRQQAYAALQASTQQTEVGQPTTPQTALPRSDSTESEQDN